MSFLNAKDKEALRDHILAIRERTDQVLRILNREKPQGQATRANKGKIIPDGVWKGEPASDRQLAVLDKSGIGYKPGLSKGEASQLIDELFRKRRESR